MEVDKIKLRNFEDCCKNCLHIKTSLLYEGQWRCSAPRKGGEFGVNGTISESLASFCVCEAFIHKDPTKRKLKSKKLEEELRFLEEENL